MHACAHGWMRKCRVIVPVEATDRRVVICIPDVDVTVIAAGVDRRVGTVVTHRVLAIDTPPPIPIVASMLNR